MSRGLCAVPILLSACVLWAGPVVAQDLDRDGLSDRLEQALLERFAPTLVLSAGECDGQPATLEPWAVDPRVVDCSGTLYGHVALRAPRPGVSRSNQVLPLVGP